MDLDKKKVILSALIATVINAAAAVICELTLDSITAEVVICSLLGLVWLGYAVGFCRRKSDS